MKRRDLLCFLAAPFSAAGQRGSASRVSTDPADGIIRELNFMRRDPAGYSEFLSARLPYYRGNILYLPGKIPLRTVEGPAAVREASAVLRIQPRLPELDEEGGLNRAAEDHIRDIGPRGIVSHTGSRGSTVRTRLARYGAFRRAAECITFGPDDARSVVIDLLVDDNVPSRGHRKILLDPALEDAGAACGPHARYGTACVLNFATNWRDRR